MNYARPGQLMGKNVVVVNPRPRMQLSKAVPVTDEFRAEINAWMLGFFGVQYDIEKGETLATAETIFMRKDDYEELRNRGLV